MIPLKLITRAYVTREYKKQLSIGGNKTTTALAIAGGYTGDEHYQKYCKAMQILNKVKEG